MRRTLIVGLTLLTLVGCQQQVRLRHVGGEPAVFAHTPIRWSFSCAIFEKDREQFRMATHFWNSLAARDLFVESECVPVPHATFDGLVFIGVPYVYSETKAWGITSVLPESEMPRSAQVVLFAPWFDAGDPLDGGDYGSTAFEVEMDAEARQTIVRHELGHVLGFEHSPCRECLMYPVQPPHQLRSACPDEVYTLRKLYSTSL